TRLLSRFCMLMSAYGRSCYLFLIVASTTGIYTLSLHDALPIFGFYVAKYVNKKPDMDLAAKGLGAKEWNNSLKTKQQGPYLTFRSEERVSRNAETELVCRLLLETKNQTEHAVQGDTRRLVALLK